MTKHIAPHRRARRSADLGQLDACLRDLSVDTLEALEQVSNLLGHLDVLAQSLLRTAAEFERTKRQGRDR